MKKINKIMTLMSVATSTMLIASGCASTSNGRNMREVIKCAPPMVEAPVAQSVGINIADARPGTQFNKNKRSLLWIPGVPYITFEIRLFGEGLPRDLQAAMIKDLQTSGIAAAVDDTAEAGACKIDVRLTEGVWVRRETYYGLSFIGAFSVCLGAPDSYGSINLAFDVAISSPEGNELGRKSFEAKTPFKDWYYTAAFSGAYRGRITDCLVTDYESISPEFRQFVLETLQSNNSLFLI